MYNICNNSNAIQTPSIISAKRKISYLGEQSVGMYLLSMRVLLYSSHFAHLSTDHHLWDGAWPRPGRAASCSSDLCTTSIAANSLRRDGRLYSCFCLCCEQHSENFVVMRLPEYIPLGSLGVYSNQSDLRTLLCLYPDSPELHILTSSETPYYNHLCWAT